MTRRTDHCEGCTSKTHVRAPSLNTIRVKRPSASPSPEPRTSGFSGRFLRCEQEGGETCKANVRPFRCFPTQYRQQSCASEYSAGRVVLPHHKRVDISGLQEHAPISQASRQKGPRVRSLDEKRKCEANPFVSRPPLVRNSSPHAMSANGPRYSYGNPPQNLIYSNSQLIVGRTGGTREHTSNVNGSPGLCLSNHMFTFTCISIHIPGRFSLGTTSRKNS